MTAGSEGVVPVTQGDELRALIAKATREDLSDDGRYFAETLSDLTRCRHEEIGEYQHTPDGKLVEWLWNKRHDIAALYDGSAALSDQRDERGGESDEAMYPTKWAGQLTVGNMIANLRTLPADMSIHSAYHVVRADKPPLLFVKTPTVSRERVDGRTIKTGDETVPYSAVIWSHCRTPDEDVEATPTDTRGGESALREAVRTIETLRRALAWHGDPQRLATTREEWQQEVDAAIVWVKANPEPDRPSFSSLAALASPAAPGGVLPDGWPSDAVVGEAARQVCIVLWGRERDASESPIWDQCISIARAALLAARPPLSGSGKVHRFGSPPEPVSKPNDAWCDAYADWYYQGRG